MSYTSIHERETQRLERQRQALVEYFQQATPGSCSLDWLNIEEAHEKILCNSIWDELREEKEQREATAAATPPLAAALTNSVRGIPIAGPLAAVSSQYGTMLRSKLGR